MSPYRLRAIAIVLGLMSALFAWYAVYESERVLQAIDVGSAVLLGLSTIMLTIRLDMRDGEWLSAELRSSE